MLALIMACRREVCRARSPRPARSERLWPWRRPGPCPSGKAILLQKRDPGVFRFLRSFEETSLNADSFGKPMEGLP